MKGLNYYQIVSFFHPPFMESPGARCTLSEEEHVRGTSRAEPGRRWYCELTNHKPSYILSVLT